MNMTIYVLHFFLGMNPEGKPVYLRDIWPTREEIQVEPPFLINLSENRWYRKYIVVFTLRWSFLLMTLKRRAQKKMYYVGTDSNLKIWNISSLKDSLWLIS